MESQTNLIQDKKAWQPLFMENQSHLTLGKKNEPSTMGGKREGKKHNNKIVREKETKK